MTSAAPTTVAMIAATQGVDTSAPVPGSAAGSVATAVGDTALVADVAAVGGAAVVFVLVVGGVVVVVVVVVVADGSETVTTKFPLLLVEAVKHSTDKRYVPGALNVTDPLRPVAV
jgi:hypothetical protein